MPMVSTISSSNSNTTNSISSTSSRTRLITGRSTVDVVLDLE